MRDLRGDRVPDDRAAAARERALADRRLVEAAEVVRALEGEARLVGDGSRRDCGVERLERGDLPGGVAELVRVVELDADERGVRARDPRGGGGLRERRRRDEEGDRDEQPPHDDHRQRLPTRAQSETRTITVPSRPIAA